MKGIRQLLSNAVLTSSSTNANTTTPSVAINALQNTNNANHHNNNSNGCIGGNGSGSIEFGQKWKKTKRLVSQKRRKSAYAVVAIDGGSGGGHHHNHHHHHSTGGISSGGTDNNDDNGSGSSSSDQLAFVGGLASSTVLDTVDIYDIRSDRWTQQFKLSEPRSSCAAVVINRTQIYIIGGNNNAEGPLSSCEVLDLSSTSSTSSSGYHTRSIPSMPSARDQHTAVPVYYGCRWYIVVVGGFGSEQRVRHTNSIIMYDVSEQRWIELPSLHTESVRHDMCIASIGPRIIIAGGYDGQHTIGTVSMLDLSRLNIQVWKPLCPMKKPRASCGIVVVTTSNEHDYMLLIGGGHSDDQLSEKTNTIELYDSIADKWYIKNMPTLRNISGACKLFLINGGNTILCESSHQLETLSVVHNANLWCNWNHISSLPSTTSSNMIIPSRHHHHGNHNNGSSVAGDGGYLLLDIGDDRIAFIGYSGDDAIDIWDLKTNVWIRNIKMSTKRAMCTAVYCPHPINAIYIFGGHVIGTGRDHDTGEVIYLNHIHQGNHHHHFNHKHGNNKAASGGLLPTIMPSGGKYGCSSILYDNRYIVIIGGRDSRSDNYYKDVDVYDIVTNTWNSNSRESGSNATSSSSSSAADGDGLGLGGGLGDGGDQAWTTAFPLPQLLVPRCYMTSCLAGDYIFVAGGYNGKYGYLSDVEILDMRAYVVVAVPSSATCSSNEEQDDVGGGDKVAPLQEQQQLVTVGDGNRRDGWRKLSNMKKTRSGCGSVVIASCNGNGSGVIPPPASESDVVTGSGSGSGVGRRWFMIMVTGGCSGPNNVAESSVEVYDSRLDIWHSIPGLRNIHGPAKPFIVSEQHVCVAGRHNIESIAGFNILSNTAEDYIFADIRLHNYEEQQKHKYDMMKANAGSHRRQQIQHIQQPQQLQAQAPSYASTTKTTMMSAGVAAATTKSPHGGAAVTTATTTREQRDGAESEKLVTSNPTSTTSAAAEHRSGGGGGGSGPVTTTTDTLLNEDNRDDESSEEQPLPSPVFCSDGGGGIENKAAQMSTAYATTPATTTEEEADENEGGDDQQQQQQELQKHHVQPQNQKQQQQRRTATQQQQQQVQPLEQQQRPQHHYYATAVTTATEAGSEEAASIMACGGGGASSQLSVVTSNYPQSVASSITSADPNVPVPVIEVVKLEPTTHHRKTGTGYGSSSSPRETSAAARKSPQRPHQRQQSSRQQQQYTTIAESGPPPMATPAAPPSGGGAPVGEILVVTPLQSPQEDAVAAAQSQSQQQQQPREHHHHKHSPSQQQHQQQQHHHQAKARTAHDHHNHHPHHHQQHSTATTTTTTTTTTPPAAINTTTATSTSFATAASASTTANNNSKSQYVSKKVYFTHFDDVY